MINIRKAVISEIETIVDFQVKMALETESYNLDIDTVTKGITAVFNDKTKGVYYVTEENNKVIGLLLITFEWSDWRNGYVWWIQSVYVLPEMRGKKIFSEMYSHIKENVMGDFEIKGLRLYVDNTNKNAQKVYNAMGMNGEHYSIFEWMK
jgi:GNAT superfamily N-acetyltransferase